MIHTFNDGSVMTVMSSHDLLQIPVWKGNRILDIAHSEEIKKAVGDNIRLLDHSPFRVVRYKEIDINNNMIEQKYIIDGQHRAIIIKAYTDCNPLDHFNVLVIEKAVDSEADAIEYFNTINNVKPQQWKQDISLLTNKYILAIEKEYNYRPTLVRAAASAAKSGEIDVVKYFIDEKGVKSFDDIMQQAASGGSLDVVKYFINEKGVKNFNDAMFDAASSGHLNVVEYLIDEKGADNFNGAIFGAALNGNLKMVKYLIDEKGISNFNSVMIAAAKGNHLNIIEYLIDEKGVNNFNDAMIGAAKFGHLDIVKFLIKKGANDFENAITSADEYGEDEIIDYIKNYMKENGI